MNRQGATEGGGGASSQILKAKDAFYMASAEPWKHNSIRLILNVDFLQPGEISCPRMKNCRVKKDSLKKQ